MVSKNFAESEVAVPPSPATSGLTLTVTTGHGVRFSPGPLVLWPAGIEATPDNAEIATVQSIAGDVLTLSARAAEDTVARAIVAGWQAAQGLTAAAWDALISRVAALESVSGSTGIDGGTPTSTFTGSTIDGGTP